MAESPVITIDGPSGTGKGTLCSQLGLWLQWHVLDSGALYRILVLLAERANVSAANAAGVAALAGGLDVRFIASECASEGASERSPEGVSEGVSEQAPEGRHTVKVLLDGQDIDDQIRTEKCGSAASSLAKYPEVRDAILDWQRSFQQPPGLIADGRDMGTVVFPGAELKIFLTANPEERAKRRYKQLNVKGIGVNLHRLSADIAERDHRDERRRISPLKPAEDAIVIDTSASGVGDVFTQVSTLITQHFGLSV